MTMPLVPLDMFRQIMQMSPYHFWQLANQDVPVLEDCNSLVREYGWQSTDNAGRDDIRESMTHAESMLREHLGYSIAPRFVTETLRVSRYHDRSQHRVAYRGSDGQWLSLQLPEGRIRAVGVETRTLIGTVTTNPGGGITLSDEDGDNLYDTFTISIATSVTDASQIAVYAGSPYRLDGEVRSERWRIKPVIVSISGGTATIKGRFWLLVRPLLYQRVNPGAIDPATLSNTMGTLDVCHYFTDPTGTTTDTAQARLIWETEPYPAWATECGGTGSVTFGDNSTDPAAEAYSIARVSVRDARRGVVSIGEAVYNTTSAVWEAVSMSFCRPPDRIDVRYQAGESLVDGQVNPRWARAVCHLAAALLGKGVCECASVSRELYTWQVDRAFAGSRDDQQFTLSPEDLSNPFGTRAGAIAAWRAVENLRELRGVLA